MTVGASVGIAVADPGHNDVDALLRNADVALYRAKNQGRSTWRIYSPDDDAAGAIDGDGSLSLSRADSASPKSPVGISPTCRTIS